jgi:Putative restriction endonuclease
MPATFSRKPPVVSSSNGRLPMAIHRFTVDQYHRLGDAGILTPEDRVELIDGWIVEKAVQKPPNARTNVRLQGLLPRVLPENVEVLFQLPITLPTSEPEPDAAVARGPVERYDEAHPGPRDVLLVIEFSDTTLEFDTGDKLLLYAAARLPVYWVVNIPDHRVEVYTNPRAGRSPTYRTRVVHLRGAKVPVVLNGQTVGEILVDDLLP